MTVGGYRIANHKDGAPKDVKLPLLTYLLTVFRYIQWHFFLHNIGSHCETKISTECEDGYFKLPGKYECGPCNCDIGRSFDPTCNKTSGTCFCKVMFAQWHLRYQTNRQTSLGGEYLFVLPVGLARINIEFQISNLYRVWNAHSGLVRVYAAHSNDFLIPGQTLQYFVKNIVNCG